MHVMLIGILLSSFFITFACCDKGYVVDFLKDKRFSCAKAFKETFTVTSEIQCTNKCLRKKCRLLNYNTKEKAMHNCEVINGQCSTIVSHENWKAVTFQVNIVDL